MDPMTRLVIERDCHRLCIDYARRADERADSFADLFTEDARLELTGMTMNGRAEIAAFMARPRPASVSRHMILNVVIDIDSETSARGLADLVYYGAVTEESVARLADISPAAIGTYQDEYRLTAEGWRIASRRMTAKFAKASG